MHAQPPIPLELGQPVPYRAPTAVHIMAGRKTKRRKRIVIPLRWITAATN